MACTSLKSISRIDLIEYIQCLLLMRTVCSIV
jgi:hypothetical protein